jgi:hypothetical protein
MMLPSRTSSPQRLPCPSCSMPNLCREQGSLAGPSPSCADLPPPSHPTRQARWCPCSSRWIPKVRGLLGRSHLAPSLRNPVPKEGHCWMKTLEAVDMMDNWFSCMAVPLRAQRRRGQPRAEDLRGGLSKPQSSSDKNGQATYTWPVSWATTNADEKPSSWFRVQLRTGWHIPVTGA